MSDVVMVPLTRDMEDEAVDVYARVFAGPPWYEIKKCSNCGRAYPGQLEDRPDGEESRYADGAPCWTCGQPLRLIDFYLDPVDRLGVRIFADAVARPGFVGFAARASSGELTGFTWGFPVPREDTPSVKFEQARDLLRARGYDPDRTFYAAEIGVVEAARGHGVATRLAFERLHRAQQEGYEIACFRTIDRERLLGLYGKLFGSENVKELFPDPDPAKSQVWYAAPLDKLRGTP